MYVDNGKIGGFTIANNSLHTGSVGATTGVYLGSSNTTSTAIGGSEPKKDWRIAAGKKFGVDSYGNIYASGGKIGGLIVTEDAFYTDQELSNGLDTCAYIGETTRDVGTTSYQRTTIATGK